MQHLTRVYTVFHTYSKILNNLLVVECTISNFRRSMVSRSGVSLLRVNMVSFIQMAKDRERNDPWEQWTHTQVKVAVVLTRYFWPIRLRQWHLNFQNSWNGLNDHKGSEIINYAIVKYWEMFYFHHTALTPAVVKINRFYKHYENTPIQIYWKFYQQKMTIFQIKILIFFIFLLKT